MLGVIQARLNSIRLPGKVLMEIKGKPLLRYVTERIALACDQVLVLCPAKDFKEIWKAAGSGCKVEGIPGDENDVFGRFRRGLSEEMKGRWFVRICADSPLIDPAVIKFVAGPWGHDGIASNTHSRTWPMGQCVEHMNIGAFLCIDETQLTPEDREHVTPWMYRNWPHNHVINPLGDFSAVNMCVDIREDFDRVSDVIGRMTRPHVEYGWHEIMEMLA